MLWLMTLSAASHPRHPALVSLTNRDYSIYTWSHEHIDGRPDFTVASSGSAIREASYGWRLGDGKQKCPLLLPEMRDMVGVIFTGLGAKERGQGFGIL